MSKPDSLAEPAPVGWFDRLDRCGEFAAAIVLSTAALGSSYGAFQESLWDGEQAAHYTLAGQARSASGKHETVALQSDTLAATVFTDWANAEKHGAKVMADYYRQRFRGPFKTQFERWLALGPESNPNAPTTPFDLPGYRESTRKAGAEFAKEADREFAEGQRANEIGDSYGQSVVIFSLALFLGGIVQTFKWERVRVVLLMLASAACLMAISRLLELPAIRLA